MKRDPWNVHLEATRVYLNIDIHMFSIYSREVEWIFMNYGPDISESLE
jgi:hypothetical protein